MTNLVLACRHCNRSMQTKDGVEILTSKFEQIRESSRVLALERKGKEGIGKDKEKIAVSVAKPVKPAQPTDEEFLKTLADNSAYRGIDVNREIGKMQAWLSTPKGRGRKLTRAFIVNWLNKVEAPMSAQLPGYIDPSTQLSEEF